jgi:hypothetical protein
MSETDPSDEHLNSNRIRQMAALRRAAIRTRSYCFIGLCVCVVGIAQLVFETARDWPVPFSVRGVWLPALYIVCMIALGAWAIPALLRLLIRFHREAKESAIPPPDRPPDFSSLQDGRQFAKNLENVIGHGSDNIVGPQPDPLPEYGERGTSGGKRSDDEG